VIPKIDAKMWRNPPERRKEGTEGKKMRGKKILCFNIFAAIFLPHLASLVGVGGKRMGADGVKAAPNRDARWGASLKRQIKVDAKRGGNIFQAYERGA